MKTNRIVWFITRGYRSLLVWEGNSKGQRMCRMSFIPRKDMTRMERYSEICRILKTLRCKSPVYVPMKREAAP